ncbi:hypothetical protein K2173_018150 [Erythroxylum novogranatense]|uniref:Uncharacterized protein n=1 Tax=Erythroxylum novogranatense TaxID=1862640 RepID=A0AAV8TL25_9ROSI|nr:hypothetical protein K2173_018150 [Erythroxylum novogranatense]
MEVQELRLEKARGFDEELSHRSRREEIKSETDKSQVLAKENLIYQRPINVSDGESKREENLKIDLMDFGNIVENQERVERLMKKLSV